MIRLVGFDGDDTLWHSEGFFRAAQAEFEALVGRHVDLADARLHERLLQIERGNLKLFGYGAKGMTLSMIEAAHEVTGGRIGADELHAIVGIGKRVLAHPVDLLPGIRAAVAAVAEHCAVVLVTKGDLFHQEANVTWAHELDNTLEPGHASRMVAVEAPAEIPAAVERLRARAAAGT